MSTMTVHHRQPVAGRRIGYTIAVGVNAVLLYLINVAPGWDAVPFLTPATPQVLPWVNAALIASAVANALYVVWDPRWFRALGDIVTTSIGIVAMVRLWQVFPLDFTGWSFDWSLVARIALGIGIGGSIIGIVVALVTLVRSVAVRE
ncbi:hypothetical protein N864_04025 [Intrasporangium chromatireducens Q5-1]|uniref:Uncharacterized protein n=1 Tax=Intrasporangium chromatireducens Q5-1 TaxID=584657 RepID=W9GKB9_9MICO|nr:hypothetical protein [Intrasporangium chromatireducens]EWT05557.1 hypothetical protein N864_04025 [Intrasporangium chromatireducens Q5-1]